MATGKKTGTFFDPPVEMNLGNNPSQVEFAVLSDFQIWIAAEENFWINIHQNLDKKALSKEMKSLLEKAEIKHWEKMQHQLDREGIITLLKRYADGDLIHRDSKAGQLVVFCVDTQDWKQAAAIIITGTKSEIIVSSPLDNEFDIAPIIYAASQIAADFSPESVDWQQNLEAKKTLINQITMQAQTESNKLKEHVKVASTLEKRIKSLDENLGHKVDEALAPHLSRIGSLNKDVVSEIKKAQDSFKSTINVLEERFQMAMNKAKEDAEKRILAVDEAYGDRMDLKAVADLWTGKRKRHKWLAIVFGTVFAASLVGVVAAAYFQGLDFIDAIGLTAGIVPATPLANDTYDIARRDWNTGGIVLAAAVGLAVYAFLRQLGRLFLTNLAQYGDADERIAMIDSFLSLEKEGKLTAKEDRILILQALFRPGPGTGAGAGDEGMPPHWFDILMRRIDPGRGGKGGDT